MDKQDIIERIKSGIVPEIAEFNQLFTSVLQTQQSLANTVIRYFLDRKGKQLRPIITILAAKMLGQVNEKTIYGAASLELLHNATLMHDDVIDQSDQRRGTDTINKIWDNHVAVLMGDFFLSKCLLCSNATGSLEISRILSDMVSELVEGELEQITNVRTHLLDEEAYYSVIRGKTASLFSACMRVGAISVGAAQEQVEALAKIGEVMGLLFQIRDDIFDYYPSTADVGKPTGHDILEGKITLPLLFALQHGPSEQAGSLKGIWEQSEVLNHEQVSLLVQFAKDAGGIEYAYARMNDLAQKAKSLLDSFSDSSSKEALVEMIDYFIIRKH